MRLQRRGAPGAEIPIVRRGPEGPTLDARSITGDFDPGFFERGGLDALRAAVADGTLPEIDVEGHRYGAPVARPIATICIGQNYAAHAAESGSPPPEVPIVFFKHPNTLCGAHDDVAIPRRAAKVDWEVELSVVIGRTARYLETGDNPLEYVAGYTIANDVSERDFQTALSGGQWSKGKCCEGFQPLGPELVVDEIADPQTLRLRSFVNDEPRQNSTTADMIFPVAELIHNLSQFMVLSAGDVINTGTPQGVAMSGRFPYLRVGDVMRLEIDGIGVQRQLLVAAS